MAVVHTHNTDRGSAVLARVLVLHVFGCAGGRFCAYARARAHLHVRVRVRREKFY